MSNRIETLNEIDKLLRDNCKGCKFNQATDRLDIPCKTTCKIGKQLMALGEELNGNRGEKLQKILNKGENMTTNEIKTLRRNSVTIKRISTATGISQKHISETVHNLGGNRASGLSSNDQSVLRNKNFNRSIKLKEAGKGNAKIAEILKLSINTVYKYNNIDNKRKELGISLDEVYDQVHIKPNRELVVEMYEAGHDDKHIVNKLNLSYATVNSYKFTKKGV